MHEYSVQMVHAQMYLIWRIRFQSNCMKKADYALDRQVQPLKHHMAKGGARASSQTKMTQKQNNKEVR